MVALAYAFMASDAPGISSFIMVRKKVSGRGEFRLGTEGPKIYVLPFSSTMSMIGGPG